MSRAKRPADTDSRTQIRHGRRRGQCCSYRASRRKEIEAIRLGNPTRLLVPPQQVGWGGEFRSSYLLTMGENREGERARWRKSWACRQLRRRSPARWDSPRSSYIDLGSDHGCGCCCCCWHCDTAGGVGPSGAAEGRCTQRLPGHTAGTGALWDPRCIGASGRGSGRTPPLANCPCSCCRLCRARSRQPCRIGPVKAKSVAVAVGMKSDVVQGVANGMQGDEVLKDPSASLPLASTACHRPAACVFGAFDLPPPPAALPIWGGQCVGPLRIAPPSRPQQATAGR